jgi:hypothetical protein
MRNDSIKREPDGELVRVYGTGWNEYDEPQPSPLLVPLEDDWQDDSTENVEVND